MNRNGKMVAIFVSLALAAAGALAAQIALPGCCVAGDYKGTHTNNASRVCPKVKTEAFTMTVVQDKKCSSKVSGKIVGTDGTVNEYTGELTAGIRGCCNFSGKFGALGHVTSFSGTFCRRLGKWSARGTYVDAEGCTGTWEITQI